MHQIIVAYRCDDTISYLGRIPVCVRGTCGRVYSRDRLRFDIARVCPPYHCAWYAVGGLWLADAGAMRSRDSYLPRARMRISWFGGGAIAKPLPLPHSVRGAAKVPHHSDDAPGTHIGRMEKDL